MKKSTRNILILITVFFVTVFGIIGYAIFSVYSSYQELTSESEEKIPAELQEAKVLKGNDFLTKKEFYKIQIPGFSESVAKAAQAENEKERQRIIENESGKGIYGYEDIKVCGNEIVAVAKFGGQVFDFDGNLKREILFEPEEKTVNLYIWKQKHYRKIVNNLKIVDLENDGHCDFSSENSTAGFTLFDKDGNIIWRYGNRELSLWDDKTEEEENKEIYVTEAAVLDLDNDGKSEFIISEKNKGITAFNINKEQIWFQPENFPTAEFKLAEVDGDNQLDLLEFQGASSTIRDKKTGRILKKINIEGWRNKIVTFENVAKQKVSQLYYTDKNKLTVSDFAGKVVIQSEAPLSQIKFAADKPQSSSTPIYIGNNLAIAPGGDFESAVIGIGAKAIWVNLQKDKSKYLAVVGSFIAVPRSNFYIYDEKGNLIYHEILSEEAETIAAIPTANSTEDILIGGKNTIWRFAAK